MGTVYIYRPRGLGARSPGPINIYCPHVAGGGGGSAAREPLHVVDIGPADALLAAVGEAGGPVARFVAVEAGDRVAPEDHRAVDAQEQGRIEIRFELGDGAVDQPGAGADVKAH